MQQTFFFNNAIINRQKLQSHIFLDISKENTFQ